MMSEHNDPLQHLMARYRDACPEVSPSPEFMPQLWQRIDARRALSWKLRAWGRVIVTAAATLCFAIAMLQLAPIGVNPTYERTYVEALEADQTPETMAFADMVVDPPAPGNPR